MAGAPRTSEKTGSGRRCCVDRPGLHSPGGWGKAGFNARQPTTAPHRAAAPRGPGKGWLSQGHPHPSCVRKFGVREEAGDTGPQATRALGASSAPAATIPRRRGTPRAGVKPQQPSEPPSACELGQAVNPLLKRAKPGPTLRVSTGETPSTALARRTGNTTSSTALLTGVGPGRRCVGGAPPPAGPAPASPLAGHGRLAFCPATRSSRPLVSSAPQYGGSGGRRHGHTHNPKSEDWCPAPVLLLPPPPETQGQQIRCRSSPSAAQAPARRKGVRAHPLALSVRASESGWWCWLVPCTGAHGTATGATQDPAAQEAGWPWGLSHLGPSIVLLSS